jgi:hypothetical protein
MGLKRLKVKASDEYIRRKRRMTYKEKLMKEHPDCVGAQYVGGCRNCPADYFGGAPNMGKESCVYPNCTICWNSEIPEEKKEPKTNGHKIVLELEPYCGDCTEFMPVIAEDTRTKELLADGRIITLWGKCTVECRYRSMCNHLKKQIEASMKED